MKNETRDIVFFDGDCNFCNSSVNFIFEKRSKNNIYFASLQSKFAKKTLPSSLVNQSEFNTIYFYTGGKIHNRSSAILRIVKHLKQPFRSGMIFIIVPKFIRDFFYNIVAKNRHRIIKSTMTCRLTSTEERKFFLDNE
jgi:predicted DCC family thiol-disulfide oxidoreductase YuxK